MASRSAIPSRSDKPVILYGKGELSPEQDALLRRVIAVAVETRRLEQECSELFREQEKLLLLKEELQTDIDALLAQQLHGKEQSESL